MGFFGSLTGKDQRKDMARGYAESTGYLKAGEDKARGEINTGFGSADTFLSQAGSGINAGYNQAGNALNQGQSQAMGLLDPYIQSGRDANGLYGDALGLNGVQDQQDFGANYAASDPFRQQNSNFATEDLMRSLNARGMSGSGYAAEAVAQQSLRRGSEDYQNYLSRLSGVRDSGQQAATNGAQIAGNFAGQRAGLATGRAEAQGNIYGARASNATGRGNALSTLSYGNAQQMANQRMGLANATASSRTQGVNNILGGLSTLGGMAISGFTPAANGATPFSQMFGK
jgi:hypothetical protein